MLLILWLKDDGNDDDEDDDDGGFREHLANGIGSHGLEDSAAARSAVRALGDMTRGKLVLMSVIPSNHIFSVCLVDLNKYELVK